MRIASYGATLTDLSTPVKTTNAARFGDVQPGNHPASVDKTTLSANKTAAEDRTVVPSGNSASGDTASLSSRATAAQSLTQSALQTATARASKVEDLRLAVNSAQYKLDSAKIAEALLNGGI